MYVGAWERGSSLETPIWSSHQIITQCPCSGHLLPGTCQTPLRGLRGLLSLSPSSLSTFSAKPGPPPDSEYIRFVSRSSSQNHQSDSPTPNLCHAIKYRWFPGSRQFKNGIPTIPVPAISAFLIHPPYGCQVILFEGQMTFILTAKSHLGLKSLTPYSLKVTLPHLVFQIFYEVAPHFSSDSLALKLQSRHTKDQPLLKDRFRK